MESCVPVSVERSDQDKDADENVDADHVRTERPVESEQSIGLFTQREEIDIDFRVSGLPHAVVKQAENFRVRELVKKIESHPHREALQADLQQNNAYNPFSDESKAMIREMGNAESYSSYAKQVQKVQCSECLLYWNQGIVYCTCGHLLVESESSQHFHQGDWMLSQSSTTSSRRGDLVVLGTAKLRHRKSISWPTMRGRDVSKRILMEFTIASNEIQHIVIRNSKLAGPRRSASRWTNWHRKTTPIAHPLRSSRDVRKTGIFSLNKSGRNAPMKLRSDFREAVTIMHRLHRESGEERPEPIPFHQYQRWHSSSSSSTSWWQWNENWWSS